jgi:uncharacterized RDD family membrane protein YckC
MPTVANQRGTITPDAFTVAPKLLGLPLASPKRRALAMGIDLVLVAILIKSGGLLLGVTAALVLWRFSSWTGSGGFIKRSVRLAFRVTAAVVVFIAVANVWGNLQSRANGNENEDRQEAGSRADLDFNLSGLNLSPGDAVRLMTLTSALSEENDELDARVRADSIAALLRSAGATSERLKELRAAALLIARADENRTAHAAIDSAFGVPPEDDIVREQQTQIETLSRENRRLRSEAENRKEPRGLRLLIASAADDLGLGVGWMAVYFTAFLGFMRGQTPGKRVLGIRVVRLDAKPIGFWIAFERFGGYAGSAALGFLGFLQILWDRNRQGFHDKAVDTVVIREA